MRYSISFTAGRIFRIAIVLIAVLFFAGLLAAWLLWVRHYEVALGFIPLFNLDGEFNLPSLFSVCLIAGNGLLLFLVSRHQAVAKNSRRYWRVLGFIFFYLAFDEFTGAHERIGGAVYRLAPNLIHASESRYWILPMGIFLLVFAVYFFGFYLSLPKREKINFAFAGAVYILGAMGIEYLGDLYIGRFSRPDVYYAYLSCFEELFEMTGMALFLRALLGYLQTLSESRQFRLVLFTGSKEDNSLSRHSAVNAPIVQQQ